MTEAQGTHDHPVYKLGRRSPSNGPAIDFAEHLRAVPEAPIADPAPGLAWPMDENDQWGDCVVAGVDHALQAIDTALVGSYANWSRDQILAYYRTQNPGFDPNTGAGDNGMDIQTFLAYLVKQGVILGFARVDHASPADMHAATWLGLGLVTGELLTKAQQTQQVWDPVAGDPIWGGHCTVTVGYGPDRDTCVTWGGTKDMTEAFVARAVEEAWFVITQAHVDHPGFRAAYDLAGFAAAYEAITGRPFPLPVGPPPAPTPPADPDQALAELARPWAAARHRGANRVMATALKAWLAAKNLG